MFREKDEAQQRRDALQAEEPVANVVSPVLPALRAAQQICETHHVRLLVVALPLDVQVSPDEWRKYGKISLTPEDMATTEVLLRDIVEAAHAVGAIGIDVTMPLREAEPGAFLDGDLHMTPRGHAAVAVALVEATKDAVRP